MTTMKRRGAAAAVALCLAATAPAGADLIQAASLDELVAISDAAIVGEVIGSKVIKVDKQIKTLTTFAVSDAMFGDVGSTVTVVTDGGVYRGGPIPLKMSSPGTPEFSLYASSMLLLKARDDGAYAVTAFNEGFFPIRDAKGDGLVSVRGASGGVPVAEMKDAIMTHRGGVK